MYGTYFAIQSIIGNVKDKALPFCMSFIDLRNAFGSVFHCYILDMLRYIRVPSEVQVYMRNLYSTLVGCVATKAWATPSFMIGRGVFQGYTTCMSQLLFVIAFHPIIAVIPGHLSRGYSLLMDHEKEVNSSFPFVGKYIYAYWKEDNSDEKVDWYLAKIISVNDEGEATLLYHSNRSFESVSLLTIKWVLAKGNGKWYPPPGSKFPHQPAKQ